MVKEAEGTRTDADGAKKEKNVSGLTAQQRRGTVTRRRRKSPFQNIKVTNSKEGCGCTPTFLLSCAVAQYATFPQKLQHESNLVNEG